MEKEQQYESKTTNEIASRGYLEVEETRMVTYAHVFNGILFFAGLGAIAISLWVWIEISWFDSRDGIIDLMGPLYYVSNFTPVAEGGVLFFVVMIGAVGLCSRSRCTLVWYFGLLLLLCAVSLVLAIISLTLFFELTDTIKSSMLSRIRDHYDTQGHETTTKYIDDIQIEFQCCGSTSYSDWASSQWYQNQNNSRARGADVPRIPSSCCVQENITLTSTSSSSSSSTSPSSMELIFVNETACMLGVGDDGTLPNMYMYSRGCHQYIKDPIDVQILTLAILGIALFIVQSVCVGVLINLFKKMGPQSPAQMNFQESDTARQTLDKLDYWLDRETEEIKRQSAQRKKALRKSIKSLTEKT
ncbi:tetraspanin-18-like [Diadema antillarum]|uniref:tetraspanin-18-like n=1 Tax=Diadema antillarum TaxID=105358 RepID=UPI003A877AEA